MNNHLYFICPTDCLETVIDDITGQKNYFCTSLGNSITFDTETLSHINKLVKTKQISEITFVLSDTNRIFKDIINNQNFSHIKGLNKFYFEILKQKKDAEILWDAEDIQIPILSYFLNLKVKELQPKIGSWVLGKVKVNGKIYHQEKNTLEEVHTDFFMKNAFNLN